MRSRAGGLTEGAERTEFTNGATEKTETKRRRHVRARAARSAAAWVRQDDRREHWRCEWCSRLPSCRTHAVPTDGGRHPSPSSLAHPPGHATRGGGRRAACAHRHARPPRRPAAGVAPSRCSKPSGRLRFAFVDSVAPLPSQPPARARPSFSAVALTHYPKSTRVGTSSPHSARRGL